MLFRERFIARDVDGQFKLNVLCLALQLLKVAVDGRELVGKPPELAPTLDNPYETDMTSDGSFWRLEERPRLLCWCDRLFPTLDNVAKKWNDKCSACAACK